MMRGRAWRIDQNSKHHARRYALVKSESRWVFNGHCDHARVHSFDHRVSPSEVVEIDIVGHEEAHVFWNDMAKKRVTFTGCRCSLCYQSRSNGYGNSSKAIGFQERWRIEKAASDLSDGLKNAPRISDSRWRWSISRMIKNKD